MFYNTLRLEGSAEMTSVGGKIYLKVSVSMICKQERRSNVRI